MRIPALRPWDMVEIKWIDAHGGDDGWRPVEGLDHTPETVVTVGQVVRSTRRGVTVTLSRVSPANTTIGGYLFIPRVNITEVCVLRRVRSRA